MTHYDGKGVHPTIRPQQPNRRKDRAKLKVFTVAKPKSWQLAMMRIGALAVEDTILLGKLIESGVLFANETMQIGPMSGGERNGTIGDYRMQFADPSRPPPKQDVYVKENTFVTCEQTAENVTATTCNHSKIHRLQKYLFRLLFMTLPFIATAIMSASCHKEPYDVVIDWRTDPISNATAQKEILSKAINNKNVNMIFLDFGERNFTPWWPAAFHRVRDTLQMYIDMAPGRIRGMGTIQVNSSVGAHLPDVTIDTIAGMALEDSLWFTANGWKVQRLKPPHNK